MKLHLVWNEAMSECCGFTDEDDAMFASNGVQTSLMVSTLADGFRGWYADDEYTILPMTTVDVPDPA